MLELLPIYSRRNQRPTLSPSESHASPSGRGIPSDQPELARLMAISTVFAYLTLELSEFLA